MKITIPHMGNLYIPIKGMLEYLDREVVLPPPTSKRTLTLGTQHSPEFACLPMKINIGNFIEASELGADTILMAGGVGPCRFGFYAQVQREILADLGYNLEMLVLEPPDTHISELLQKIRVLAGKKSWLQVIQAIRFGYHKAKTVDAVERQVLAIRPKEKTPGTADKILAEALEKIDQAQSFRDVSRLEREYLAILREVELEERDVLHIAVVGEIYTVLEPFCTFNIEKQLGKLGVLVDRSIYLSDWINEHLFQKIWGRGSHLIQDLAKPYLNHFVGGHGRETIGSTVNYAGRQFDGVIQVAPFTCMPEIVAQSVLPKVSREKSIPSLTLYFDEHTGEAGVATRLEAFVDLLARRRSTKTHLHLDTGT